MTINIHQNRLIVSKPDDLTVKWAQTIVNQQANPEVKNTKIEKLEIVSVEIGTTTRVRLKVDHDGSAGLPKRWFVKLPSLSLRARTITAFPRLLPTEIRFYKEIASTIPVKKPQVLAAHSQFGKGSTLVIHDVTEMDAIPGHPGDALTFEQARLVIEQLAYFHAHFMDKAKYDSEFRWLAGSVRRLEDGLGTTLAIPLMRRGLRLAADKVPAQMHNPALQYSRYRRQIMHFLSNVMPTLIHHDCHPGNLFWHNGQPGFLDWQMVRIGEGIGDVSYFLATALKPETRRLHELELLARYHEIIQANSSTSTDFTELLNRYRVHLVYPFEAMIVTLAVGGMMSLDGNLEMIRRAALAIEDHDTFMRLPYIT